jgi:hypothetical protein
MSRIEGGYRLQRNLYCRHECQPSTEFVVRVGLPISKSPYRKFRYLVRYRNFKNCPISEISIEKLSKFFNTDIKYRNFDIEYRNFDINIEISIFLVIIAVSNIKPRQYRYRNRENFPISTISNIEKRLDIGSPGYEQFLLGLYRKRS